MPSENVIAGRDLQRLLGQGARSAGRSEDKRLCLKFAQIHLESALHTLKGPHPFTCILDLEYSVFQLGNAIAMAFKRNIENRPDSAQTHTLAASVVVEYCAQFHRELLGDAALVDQAVRQRNDYMYRHQAFTEQDARRLGRAVGTVYQALYAEVDALSGVAI